MYSIAFCVCIYNLSSFHMSLVLTVDDLVTVRKWHILNRDACNAKIKLEKNKKNPNLNVLKVLNKRIIQHEREMDEVQFHMNNRLKWNDEVRSKQLKASV